MAIDDSAAYSSEPARCFGCGDYTDNVFGDGACSHMCRSKREKAVVGLGLAIRQFVRRARVRDLINTVLCGIAHHTTLEERSGARMALAEMAFMALEEQ
jgi:hypothetical protein